MLKFESIGINYFLLISTGKENLFLDSKVKISKPNIIYSLLRCIITTNTESK